MKPSTPLGLKGLFWYFPASARDKNWGVYVTTIGNTHVAPRKPYPPPGHPETYDFKSKHGRALPVYALVYISKGRGWLGWGVNNQRQTLEAGDVFLIFPGMWHRYRPEVEVGWDENWVAFDGDVARRWIKECSFFSPDHPIVKCRNQDGLLAMFTKLIEIGQKSPAAYQQLMSAQVQAMLAMLYSEHQTAPAPDDTTPVLQIAQARMQNEFTSDLKMQALARDLKVSYSWFRHAFVQRTGFSPHQYLLELRLAHARSLLVQSSLKVKEIAARSGFADEHYFSRIFKAKAGLTANEWRIQARRKGAA